MMRSVAMRPPGVARTARGRRRPSCRCAERAPSVRRFEPREANQFDWSHEVVLTCGVTVTVKVAHMRLCHSRMPRVAGLSPRDARDGVRRA